MMYVLQQSKYFGNCLSTFVFGLTLKNGLFCITSIEKKVTQAAAKTFTLFKLIMFDFKCYLHHNCSVNLNWNNTQLYSSAKPLRNVPSSVCWFVNFCFLPFLHRTSSQKWKKSWLCYGHKWTGKKEMVRKNYWSHTFSLACQVDEFSFEEMRTWGQSKFTSYYINVWCESEELGGRRSLRFSCVIPVVDTSLDRVAKHQLLCINSQQPKQFFHKKTPPQTSDWISNADPTRGASKVGCGLNANAWNLRP